MGIRKYDEIYDESGIIIGEAPALGESRPETEEQDMYWCDICEEFHAVGEDCPPPKHDPIRYVVEESETLIDRSYFVLAYLAAKEKCRSLLA